MSENDAERVKEICVLAESVFVLIKSSLSHVVECTSPFSDFTNNSAFSAFL